MSDDESLVILGSCSPGNSLLNNENYSSGFLLLNHSQIEKDDTSNIKEVFLRKESTSKPEIPKTVNNIEQISSDQKTQHVEEKGIKTMENSAESNKSVKTQIINSQNVSASSGNSAQSSLAASFIMGEVDAEVLKTSVYSQFPSLCSMESNAEDVVKLQNLLTAYVQLKTPLVLLNDTIRKYYDKTQIWRQDVQESEQRYKEQIEQLQKEIASLRNENLSLKNEVNEKLEQVKISESIRQKEAEELTQCVSEQKSLIDNMREHIDRLERQSMASFEYIPKHGNDNDTKEHPDYVPRSEHLLAIKELERKMSTVVAENYELKDMRKIYEDEINCLKVNLTSAEELMNESRGDIQLLKASDMEKSVRFVAYENERDKMREEINLLRHQVDVYNKDFQIERSAREVLAGEKEQLLRDLRSLQRANQQLIEAQQRRLDNAVEQNIIGGSSKNENGDYIAAPPTAAVFEANLQQRPIRRLPETTPKPSNNASCFTCPICNKAFKALTVLQSHVDSCLDKI